MSVLVWLLIWLEIIDYEHLLNIIKIFVIMIMLGLIIYNVGQSFLHRCRSRSKSAGAWLSPVERTVRDREIDGSNPFAPIKSQDYFTS